MSAPGIYNKSWVFFLCCGCDTIRRPLCVIYSYGYNNLKNSHIKVWTFQKIS